MNDKRERLPMRRGSKRIDFVHTTPALAQLNLTATIGFYEDGRPGEVFLNTTKVGTDFDTATKDAAILLSFALQYGATLEDIRSSMTRDAQGKPEGVMGTLLDLLSEITI